MKLTVIGGGSTYTPELADGIGRLLPSLAELVLVDPDAERLAAVGPVSARIMAAHGHPARVRWTGSLDDGADGADAILFQLRIGGQAALLGVPPAAVSLGHVGLNHLTWERSVLVDDKDVLPDLIATRADEIARRTEMPADFVRRLGMVPSPYLRYYYAHDEVLAARRGAMTRAEEVARLEAELLELYADPTLDRKPDQLARRGGAWYSEAAVDLLRSLTDNRRDVQVVNTANGLTLPFLPADAVIEVPAVISGGGAVPVPVEPIEPLLRGLIAHVYAYEELALDAATRGGRDRVYEALLAHPLVGQADQAECLTDRLLAENATFLPWARGDRG